MPIRGSPQSHGFGSYHLARFADAAALVLQTGNSLAMIFKHYRQLTKPRAAEAFRNLHPTHAENVVASAA